MRQGGLMCNWNQMRVLLHAIPSYELFLAVFKGWQVYDPENPPPDAVHPHLPHSRSKKFFETRYLADARTLASWCSFELLYANNPRLHGCSQCYINEEQGEIKFVSGLWVTFFDDPTKAHHARFKLTGSISTLHWNGSCFNSGDEETSVIGASKSKAMRQTLSDDEQRFYEERFSQLVVDACSVCIPKMRTGLQKKRDAANHLKAVIERHRAKA